MNESLMSIYEETMLGSMVLLFALYYYMKILLKMNGYKIHLFMDYGKDYQSFKRMIEHENNPRKNKTLLT